LNQQLEAMAYRGKHITLRAAVRTAVKGPGNQAYLWLRVSRPQLDVLGPRAPKGFYYDMAHRPITASAWRNYEITGDVAADATTIDYGLALVGEGSAWLDDVAIEFNE
jgi:erythromycin esterase